MFVPRMASRRIIFIVSLLCLLEPGALQGDCIDGEVRLVDGSNIFEGRVEVCNGGAWGTVCDDIWSTTHGHVVCNQLGYGQATSAPCCARFGPGTGDIVLDNVRCTGTESSIFDCSHNGLNNHNCRHLEDAGVRCTGIGIVLVASQSPITVVEGMSVDVCVIINNVLGHPVLVALSAIPTGENGATIGMDLPNQLTTTIPPDMTQSCISILLTDDDVIEGPQTFSVEINSTSPALTNDFNLDVIIVIEDNDGYVLLDSSVSPVTSLEGTTVDVCVNISGIAEVDVEVFFATFPIGDSEATVGLDYPDYLNTTIPSGMTQSCVSILLNDDDVIEGPQTFSVGIDSTSPALTDNSISDVIVVIEDNDVLKLGFQESEYSFPEASEVNFSVCVESIGQIESSVSFLLTVDSLTTILRGEPRTIHILGGIHIFGAEAGPLNVLTDETLCINITNDDDGLKEGTQVHMLRLETNDSFVCLGRDQVLLIEEANGICSLSILTLEPSVTESAGSVEFCVTLNQLPIQAVITAQLSLRPGDAKENVDYIPIDTIYEWHQDSTFEQCTDIPIVNDLAVEETEFFLVDVVGEDVTLTTMVSIIDDDSILVDYRAALFETDESAEVISSCVYICNGELQRNVTLLVHVLNGSASYPDDFSVDSLHYELTFTPENSDQDLCVNISIVDDGICESFEYFQLSLSSLDSSVEFKQEIAEIEISDKDCVSVRFVSANNEVTEGDNGIVCVQITGELAREVVVTVTGLSGTADGSSVDHDFPQTTFITFNTSPDVYCLEFTTTQDGVYEDDEIFTGHITTTDSQVVLNVVNTTVTILDDDKVGFSLSVDESVCEGAGRVLACVQLETDIEMDALATLETADGIAQDPDDYIATSITFTFSAPLPAGALFCIPVRIIDDSVLEPCEDFMLSVTSSSKRSFLIGDDSVLVVINDDEASDLLLFNNSPQINGTNLTAYFILTGCAQVFCEVKFRTGQIDCSPAAGSFEGHWFAPSVTGRNTLQNMAITVQPYCSGQVVPDFEDRPFRTDNEQCSQHFTDQQYIIDSASGNVTVEWEGTGPNEIVQVSEFTCNVDGGTSFSCISPTVLPGLALTPGNHTLNILPVGIDGCTRMVGRSLLISV